MASHDLQDSDADPEHHVPPDTVDEGSPSRHRLESDDATICRHLDGPTARRFIFPRRRGPSEEDYDASSLPVTPQQFEPWLCIIRELLIGAQVPTCLVQPILQTFVPKIYHGMPLNIAGSVDESTQAFHYFPRLPPELRLKICAFAAEAEPRIIDFIQYISSSLPLNGSGDVPALAKACSEAWHVVMAKESYWQPAQADSEKPHLKYWASDTDILYLREIDPFDERVAAGNLDFLRSRKIVAVDHDDFVTQGSGEDHYSWLRDSEAVETLILVKGRTPCVFMTIDHHSSLADCCGPVFWDIIGAKRIWDDQDEPDMRVMQKLVTYDEPRELERLNGLWRGLDPNGTWLFRHGPPEQLEKASMWDDPNEATCLACELKLGRRMAREAREAMVRMIWSDYSSDSEKEDEIGMGQGAVATSSEGGHRTPRPRRMRFLTGIMMELVREPLAF